MTSPNHRDLIPSAGLILLGGYALYEASSMSAFGAIFPRLAGGGMTLGGMALAVRALVFNAASPVPAETLGRPALMLATLAAWAVALPIIGFIPASLIGAAAAMVIAMNDRPSAKELIYHAVGLTALILAIAGVFGGLLNVPLP